MSFVIGLDLASVQDFTAVSVLQSKNDGEKRKHHCNYLKRWRKSYPETVSAVAMLANLRELRSAVIVADQTGVGRPVVDMLREALPGRRVMGVTITAGSRWSRGEHRDDINCPKKLLVSTLQVLFAERRLTYSKELDLVPVLQGELQNFKVKITPHANETFEAGREGQHDDLVLSLGLASWIAETAPRPLTDARVEAAVLNETDHKTAASGEVARTRMEELAEDHPHLFGNESVHEPLP